ncbi:MAG: DUF6338 family protein [Methylococcaceae bacterium]|jgi:hypothetical protein|nr:DUF6338 family protein [Methylococcaceae bacterium]MDZ4156024.1 DUF6338 family protein [Methylococcales bacterium]MDP2395157.1 DUF6338 family protein [Methylococcaceae bacterium]MDP3018701.1 DUF6338 family protein [Methylococcaceae bacterium]MDP3388895.1 DUF6338 family protein [Methylococcaceae bacterium]
MPEISETIQLLQYLLPGFLAAWIFYGLTSHLKPIQFERVIQALVFTLIINVLIVPTKWALLHIGNIFAVSQWNSTSELVTSVIFAILIGGFLSHLTNNDSFHSRLRRFGFTTRSSHPSEWHGVLSQHEWYVVLHFKDDKRLLGYPKVWPSEPEKGHFYIMQPSWLGQDGTGSNIEGCEGILVNTSDVRWVEFVNKEN